MLGGSPHLSKTILMWCHKFPKSKCRNYFSSDFKVKHRGTGYMVAAFCQRWKILLCKWKPGLSTKCMARSPGTLSFRSPKEHYQNGFLTVPWSHSSVLRPHNNDPTPHQKENRGILTLLQNPHNSINKFLSLGKGKEEKVWNLKIFLKYKKKFSSRCCNKHVCASKDFIF